MAISKTKNYLVLNYNQSPVAVKTKYDSFMIEPAFDDAPGSLPLTIDEIQVINSNSPVFKVGLLRFETVDQEDIYEALRIENWRSILTNDEIEDYLLNPSVERLQKFLDIESDIYFERIRGVYMGLKNSGANLSMKVSTVIDGRRAELAAHKRKSEILVKPAADAPTQNATQHEVDELRRQLDEMQKLMQDMRVNTSDANQKAETTKVSKTRAGNATAKK